MNTKTSFEDFLKQKSAEKKSQFIDKEELKREWIESVYILYDKIQKWLHPFEQKELLTIKRENIITIHEAMIGEYQIQQLDIYIGNDIINLVPVARVIIGGKGRIDMKSEKGEVRIVRYANNEWKFIQKIVKMETWEINEQSFKTELQNLAN